MVIPFPRTRDRTFVERQARFMAASSPNAAEKHLAVQLDRQSKVLHRRGIAPELIDQHLHALELAIRAAFWRLAAKIPGGAA